MKNKKQSGITLVALVVTIVVLLILAGVSVNLVLGENGLITQAKEAKVKSTSGINEENYLVNSTIPDYIEQQVNENVVIGGKTITKENLSEYLGKEVKYTPASPSTDYGTSTVYRLFYIDFDGDFGEKKSIYLKADNDGKNISLPSEHLSSDNLKIMKALNPDWSKNSGVLDSSNDNAVAWLTDPEVWKNWKDKNLSNYINYVVGSPSLEMYVKSYNLYLEKNPTTLAKNGNNALKLECKFDTEGNKYGYKISLLGDNYTTNNGTHLADNTIVSASIANGIYNPGSDKWMWLASPASYKGNSYVIHVSDKYGSVGCSTYSLNIAVCPFVSLKSSAKLEFEEN